MGAAWWVIKDVICLPHGEDTFNRHLLAYGLLGALLFATIVHPANAVYGFASGVVAGSFIRSIDDRSYPRNF